MRFRNISAKIQPKNLKQHFDWGGGFLGPPGYALGSGRTLRNISGQIRAQNAELTR